MNNPLPQGHSSESIEESRTRVEQTRSNLKETVRELSDRLRGSSRDGLEGRRRAAASHLHEAESAVREAAIRLQQVDQDLVATPLARLADSAGRMSLFLDSNSAEELGAKAAQTMRRHPLAAIGAAFAAGFVAARFLRASTPDESQR